MHVLSGTRLDSYVPVKKGKNKNPANILIRCEPRKKNNPSLQKHLSSPCSVTSSANKGRGQAVREDI